jgi:hypothetical protein
VIFFDLGLLLTKVIGVLVNLDYHRYLLVDHALDTGNSFHLRLYRHASIHWHLLVIVHHHRIMHLHPFNSGNACLLVETAIVNLAFIVAWLIFS